MGECVMLNCKSEFRIPITLAITQHSVSQASQSYLLVLCSGCLYVSLGNRGQASLYSANKEITTKEQKL